MKVVMLYLILFITRVGAQSSPQNNNGLCTIFGCDNYANVDISLVSIISLVTSFVFIFIVILGIVKIIIGVYKIIQSEDSQEKLVEGQSLIRGVWIGIGIIFLGLLGLVVVFVLFNVDGIFSINLQNNLPRGFRGNIPL